MPELTLDRAREVLDTAIKYEAFSWDDPDNATDEVVIENAQNLVDISKTAAERGSVAEAVHAILAAAQVEATSPKQEEQPRRGAIANAPRAAMARTEAAIAGATPEEIEAAGKAASAWQPTEEQPQEEFDITSIFPGYDDAKVADIKKAVEDSAASGDLTPEEWEQIRSYEAAHEERKTILSLEPKFKEPEPEPTAPSAAGGFEQTVTITPAPDGSAQTVTLTAGHENDVAAFFNGQSTSRAQQEGLPLPAKQDFNQNPPMLPVDITTTSEEDLSRIATQFHSCFAYAQWLQSQEEGRERAAEHLEREAERDAYVAAYELHKSEIPEEKRTQPTALEAARKAAEKDAEMAENVRSYRARKIRHGVDAREIKALASGYDKAVWRINEELERRSRLKVTRPS